MRQPPLCSGAGLVEIQYDFEGKVRTTGHQGSSSQPVSTIWTKPLDDSEAT